MQTLGLSLRQISSLVGHTSLYEYEDFIQSSGASHLVEITPSEHQAIENARKIFKASRLLDRSGELGDFLSRKFLPKGEKLSCDEENILFLPTFNNPYEFFALQTIEGWRDRCQYAVCYINEVWESDFKECELGGAENS